MLAVFAEFEWDILRDRVKAGIAQARKDGCCEPSWRENVELRAEKAIECENIDPKYSWGKMASTKRLQQQMFKLNGFIKRIVKLNGYSQDAVLY